MYVCKLTAPVTALVSTRYYSEQSSN